MKSKIYCGKIYHKRFTPQVHQFTYSSYFLKISLNEIPKLKNTFFSFDRFNLFSFHSKDHGHKNNRSLHDFAKEHLSRNGLNTDYDDIVIHTMPRILGHVFNPVSFWYIEKNNHIYAIIAEVNNTFGENYSYVLDRGVLEMQKTKLMQVSPFNQIEGHYQFHFFTKGNSEKVDINYFVNEKLLIHASVNGSAKDWSSANFLKLFLSNPLQNFLILIFIHYQAIRLYLKRIPFYGKNGVVHD